MENKSIVKSDFEELKIIEFYNMYRNNSYISVYKMFFNSSGLKRIALGRVLAKKMSEEIFLIDESLLVEFLSSLDIDGLWTLASSCKNDYVKSYARNKVLAFLDDNPNKKRKVYKRKR